MDSGLILSIVILFGFVLFAFTLGWAYESFKK